VDLIDEKSSNDTSTSLINHEKCFTIEERLRVVNWNFGSGTIYEATSVLGDMTSDGYPPFL
jgi:hypothetical protein